MVELGMAIALGKPTFLFRDDFRRVVESEQYPLNLMLFTGLPEQGWEDYYYTSIRGDTLAGQGSRPVGEGLAAPEGGLRTALKRSGIAMTVQFT